MTKEPLKSLIRRKFFSRQNEHGVNIDEHRGDASMFTGKKCVNIENLPNSTNKPPAPKDGNALLSTLDLRNVRPWQEGRRSPRRWLKPPLAVPEDSEPPGTARTGNSQAVAARTRERRRGEPVPGSMRWTLLPCTLVPIALELDAAGALTWQAGQFDDNVRALCEEHGAQLRAFLSTLPGHRWESWQENALDIADRWEASQGRQSIKQ